MPQKPSLPFQNIRFVGIRGRGVGGQGGMSTVSSHRSEGEVGFYPSGEGGGEKILPREERGC